MAAEPFITTRRTLLGAAAALPIAALPAPVIARAMRQSNPASALWHRRLAAFRRLHARWKEAAETGFFRAANDDYNRIYSDAVARYGTWQKACRSRRDGPRCAAAFARVSAPEEAYYNNFTAPMRHAGARLAQTPAPDLNALVTKIELIAQDEFESFDAGIEDLWDVVRQDLRRLAPL